MKHSAMLTTTSVLLILLMTFHVTDDIVRQGGMSQRGFLSSVLILVVLLYGTLVLPIRRFGYIIILLGSLLARAYLLSTQWERGSPSPAEPFPSGLSSRSA